MPDDLSFDSLITFSDQVLVARAKYDLRMAFAANFCLVALHITDFLDARFAERR